MEERVIQRGGKKMKKWRHGDILCITYTDKVSDKIPKGMGRVLLHVGLVTQEMHLFSHSDILTAATFI